MRVCFQNACSASEIPGQFEFMVCALNISGGNECFYLGIILIILFRNKFNLIFFRLFLMRRKHMIIG